MPIYLTSASGNRLISTPTGAHTLVANTDEYQKLRGGYRVANDALIQYELYRGIDTEPDFDAAPWETPSSLPHETAALAAAPGGTERTYYFTLRLRNKYNLCSQNIASWTVTVDDAGASQADHPTAPENAAIAPAAGGAVNITADYYEASDGLSVASKWAIFLTTNGSDPDPDNDSPTEETMVMVDGVAHLDYTSGTFANGLTAKTVVRTRRVDTGPVNVDSTNTTIYSTTTDTSGPATPEAAIAYGTIAEQRQ